MLDKPADFDGLRMGGRNINNIRCTDDMVLIAESAEKQQELLSSLYNEFKVEGLNIYKRKRKQWELYKGTKA